MHITTETEALRTILETVTRVSTKHVTLPILQCVYLDAQKGSITIRATNLEIGIEGTLSGNVEEEGTVAVPAHVLLQTVALISQKQISLLTEGDVLHIESTHSKTDIKTMDGSDFPSIPRIESEPKQIQSELFAVGIKAAACAASQSSIKPELGSVYIFQKREHSLTFVATDSFRLIEKTLPFKNMVFEGSLLIPFKNALELARVAEMSTGTIELTTNENQCALRAGNIYVTSRLVSGSFPDYEQIIPKEYGSTATVLTQDLTRALKKTNIFLNKFLQLTMTVSSQGMTLGAQNVDEGATTESIPAATTGDEIRLNFNQRYIMDILPYVTDDSVLCKFAGIGRPMVMENVHEKSLRYLVMPMNK